MANNPLNWTDPFGFDKEKPWWEKLEEGYYFGTGIGEEGLNWWVGQWNETGNPFYAVGGGFAALWTPDTYQQVAWTLIGGYGFRNLGTWATTAGSQYRAVFWR